MKIFNLIAWPAGISLLLIFSGCSVPRGTATSVTALPAAYTNSTDTATLATISWRRFFGDPYLVKLIDTALVRNWDLQSVAQRIRSAGADVLAARGPLRPSLDLSVASGIRRFGLYTMDGAGNISTFIQPGKIVPVDLPDYYLGLQSSWELDVWKKLRSRRKAAQARLLAGTEGRNWLVSGLVAEIAAAYYSLSAMDQARQVLTETIALQEQALGMVQTQKAAAVINELAVKQFEAELKRLEGLRTAVQQDIISTESHIRLLTGSLPGKVERDTALFSQVVPPDLQTGVPASLLTNRPDIRQAEGMLQAARADLAASRAFFFPRLQINAALGYQAFRPDLLFTTPASIAYTLLGNLTAPLLNRAALKAQFQQADAAQLEALYQYQKTVATAYTEVYTGMHRIRNLARQYQLKSAEAEVLMQSVDIAATLFRSGRATYLEVLFARQKAIQAKLEVVEIRKMQMMATVALYRSLGGGWR